MIHGALPPSPHDRATATRPSPLLSPLSVSLLLLLLATVGLMLWHQLGMDRHLVIAPGTDLQVAAYDDRTIGGESVAVLERTEDAITMRCDVRKGLDWPYCQLAITLVQPPGGVDLSGYDSVRLDLDVDAPEGSDPRVRVDLRNFDVGSSTLEDYGTMRINELEYDPARSPGGLEVPLDYFEVPDWWRTAHATSLADARPRLDNVSHVEILTAPHVVEGEHVVRVRGIRFTGKRIPRDILYLGILGVWMLAVLGYLIAAVGVHRRRARAAQRRQQELENVNQVLQLRSDDLRWQAQRDPLTGALNRAGLRELLRDRIEAARAGRAPLSLVLMDVDHFKRINDTHGHAVGDEVLRLFAQRVRDNTRPDDQLVRWGGEEFLLVCGVEEAEAAKLAEKLRAVIAGGAWPHGEPLMCSFGVGQLGDATIAGLLERVDRALYRAKASGRDRVEVARGHDAAEPSGSASGAER